MQSREKKKYRGSCHCGSVVFEIFSEIPELTECDCSICRKKNALMVKVHEDDFRLIQGESHLADYQFNTRTAHHHFCKICGIYTFHRKRTAPDHFGVNVFCLEGIDPGEIPVRNTNGASLSIVSTD